MKKLLAFILSIVLCASLCPTNTFAQEETLNLGDVDGDLCVDTRDFFKILEYAVGKRAFTEQQLIAGDVNHDGSIDSIDSIIILEYDAGIIEELPTEAYEYEEMDPVFFSATIAAKKDGTVDLNVFAPKGAMAGMIKIKSSSDLEYIDGSASSQWPCAINETEGAVLCSFTDRLDRDFDTSTSVLTAKYIAKDGAKIDVSDIIADEWMLATDRQKISDQEDGNVVKEFISAEYQDIFSNGMLYGDVTGDGNVNSLDAAQVLKYDAMMIELDDKALKAGDVAKDGAVNSLDAAAILKFDAGVIRSFPINDIEKATITNANVGDTITYGRYEQDNNLANGQEEIEWIVIKKSNNAIMVLSKYALDIHSFHSSWTSTSWEKSTLRKWINDDFYNAAFNTYEKEKIPTVTVTAEVNDFVYSTPSGNDTQDKLFCLSKSEFTQYLTNSQRSCSPTEYARSKGNTSYAYWLRTSGGTSRMAIYVDFDGTMNPGGTIVDNTRYVRPAMWITLG